LVGNYAIIVNFELFLFFVAAVPSVRKGIVIDPCTPRGYTMSSEELVRLHAGSVNGVNVIPSTILSAGNFSECRNTALALLQKGQGCLICMPLHGLYACL
jgi:hypothetical protein